MGSSFVVFPTSRVVRKDTSYEKSLNESQQIEDCKKKTYGPLLLSIVSSAPLNTCYHAKAERWIQNRMSYSPYSFELMQDQDSISIKY